MHAEEDDNNLPSDLFQRNEGEIFSSESHHKLDSASLHGQYLEFPLDSVRESYFEKLAGELPNNVERPLDLIPASEPAAFLEEPSGKRPMLFSDQISISTHQQSLLPSMKRQPSDDLYSIQNATTKTKFIEARQTPTMDRGDIESGPSLNFAITSFECSNPPEIKAMKSCFGTLNKLKVLDIPSSEPIQESEEMEPCSTSSEGGEPQRLYLEDRRRILHRFQGKLDHKIEEFPHIKEQLNQLNSIKDKVDKKQLAKERNQMTAKLSRDKYKVEMELLKEYVAASVLQLNLIRNALASTGKRFQNQNKALLAKLTTILDFNQDIYEVEDGDEAAPSKPLNVCFGTRDLMAEWEIYEDPEDEKDKKDKTAIENMPVYMKRVLTRVKYPEQAAKKNEFLKKRGLRNLNYIQQSDEEEQEEPKNLRKSKRKISAAQKLQSEDRFSVEDQLDEAYEGGQDEPICSKEEGQKQPSVLMAFSGKIANCLTNTKVWAAVVALALMAGLCWFFNSGKQNLPELPSEPLAPVSVIENSGKAVVNVQEASSFYDKNTGEFQVSLVGTQKKEPDCEDEESGVTKLNDLNSTLPVLQSSYDRGLLNSKLKGPLIQAELHLNSIQEMKINACKNGGLNYSNSPIISSSLGDSDDVNGSQNWPAVAGSTSCSPELWELLNNQKGIGMTNPLLVTAQGIRPGNISLFERDEQYWMSMSADDKAVQSICKVVNVFDTNYTQYT